jgi:bis(5'-nucleosyl)-tetraphosphatase (symmetrical)
MATYIIGDVQGCYQELQQLLQLIEFNPKKDRLGFVGDLVNRGPNSLEVLRFIKSLSDPMVVLGNHDLYLLILGYELMPSESYQHTLHPIFAAPDKIELLDWLRQQPLIYHHPNTQTLLVHAGLPPQWSIAQSITHAKEVESALQGNHFREFLRDLFGNDPSSWNDRLTGQERLRYITNAFTRMRFCDESGYLDLKADGNISTDPHRFHPWFDFRNPQQDKVNIVFGHWAALNGQCDAPGCYALDTGCAWGYSLTALRLEDKKRFSISCVSHHPSPRLREKRDR